MKPNNDTPSIRFVGFTDAWEQRKVGDFAKVLSAARVHKHEWTEQGVPFFRSSDVMSVHNGRENEKVYISQELFEDLSMVSGRPEKGDIFITGGGSIGMPYIVPNDNPLYSKDADLLWIKKSENHNSQYLYSYFFTPTFRSYIASISHIGTIAHYTIVQVKETPVLLPKIREQEKIGSFFSNLDSLITLHQRKYDQLVNIKKSMQEKMFPKNGELVPEVRFAGFTDAWEQREFGETFTFLQNNTLSRADLTDSGDGAKNIHYGDILVKFGECINLAKVSLPIITNESVINKYRSSVLKNGDIVIADTAEDETVGKCTEIIEEKGETIISGLHTIPCRPTCDFAGAFLGYYMNSSAFHDQLLPLMQGIKVTSISKSALQTTMVQYPQEKEEQAQIGCMFQLLDTLITLHQRKLERLQNIKKACLEKMFV